MAAPLRKSVQAKPAASGSKASVRLAGAQDQAGSNPVLQWRETLPEQWAESQRHAAEPTKWSTRRTAAFIALSCGGFWACVALGVARLAH
jgi:hypothetical protein